MIWYREWKEADEKDKNWMRKLVFCKIANKFSKEPVSFPDSFEEFWENDGYLVILKVSKKWNFQDNPVNFLKLTNRILEKSFEKSLLKKNDSSRSFDPF